MAPVNVVDLADLVIEQSAIGCLLKQVQDNAIEDDGAAASDEDGAAAASAIAEPPAAAAAATATPEDEVDEEDANVVYALVSALSLKSHAKRDGIQSLIKWMSSKLGQEKSVSRLLSLHPLSPTLGHSLPLLSHLNVHLVARPAAYHCGSHVPIVLAGNGEDFEVSSRIRVQVCNGAPVWVWARLSSRVRMDFIA